MQTHIIFNIDADLAPAQMREEEVVVATAEEIAVNVDSAKAATEAIEDITTEVVTEVAREEKESTLTIVR